MEGLELLILLFLLLNLFGFFLMRADKQRAIRRQYRVSEKNLWLVALFGGATGMTIGMKVFHHKTKHLTFKIGLPAVMIMHFLLIIYLMV